MDQSLEVSLRGSEFRRFWELQFAGVREAYDLKKVEIDVLYYLSQHRESDTPTEIHQKLLLNRGHVSQAIDSLYQKGYLLAIPDHKDRRFIHYTITEQARPALAEITAIRRQLDRITFQDIPEEDLAVFRRVLAQIKHNLQEMLD